MTGELWVNILEDEDLAVHRTALIDELAKTIDLWHPYKTLDGVIDDIDAGNCQAWAGGRGDKIEIWGLTDMVSYPGTRAIRILWCSGTNGNDYFRFWTEKVEMLAEALGVDLVEIRGRPGWVKVFEPYGYKLQYVTILKEVGHARRRIGRSHADQQGRVDEGAEGADGSGDRSGQADPGGGNSAAPGGAGV